MCGIVGIVRRDGEQPAPDLIGQMNAVQLHRGPDEGNTYHNAGIALGHRRLSIIDLSSGQQPMADESGRYVLVFNGEIYNFPELREELIALGHTFRTHCDTEVILQGHIAWGDDCVARLRGMFAYALWDNQAQKLLLVRDRLGIKPLYYAQTPKAFYFASELKSLKCVPDIDRTIDERAVELYFALGYVPDPLSIYRSVRKLPPGHTASVNVADDRLVLKQYWDASFATASSDADDEAFREQLLAQLRDATDSHMITDVPLGSFLSGGVDSSAVVALMAEASTAPVRTCSIGFDVGSYDETDYARQVAQRFGTVHAERKVSSDDFSTVGQLAGIYDEPFADSSALPTYRVCGLARETMTVAMSGDGADELLGGYRRYRMLAAEDAVRRRTPAPLRRAVFGPLGALYPKLDWAPRFLRAKSTLQSLAMDTTSAYLHCVSHLKHNQRQSLFSDELKAKLGGYNAIELFREHADAFDGEDALGLLQYIDLKTWLAGDILTKVDRASMAHSLEVRVPFLDHRFAEWCLGLPRGQKLRGGVGKFVLKGAMERYLPRDILYRPKMGFRVPVAEWFRGPLQAALETSLLSSEMRDSGFFNLDAISRLLREHIAGVRDHSAALWSLFIFSQFLAAEAGAVP